MGERELEHVMRDFYAQRVNLLVCSTIIETGIDVPTANTIIIDRADRFGLAQLHQLRGRVGRSHHQAYAYLLTPPEEALSAQAKKRLEAIQMMEDLGSGFYLAMHDLEIRGAGEVLGDEQSGEMQQIGFQLYADMLKAAVSALQARDASRTSSEPLGVTTEINLHVPALLPETYCNDVHERLVLYKRLASCDTDRRARPRCRRSWSTASARARAGAGAARVPSAAPARQAARRGEDRRRTRAHARSSSCKHPPFDPGALILAGPARRPHPLRGPGPHPHRARRADARRARRARPRFPRPALRLAATVPLSLAAAGPRVRSRLAVVEQRPAEESRRATCWSTPATRRTCR